MKNSPVVIFIVFLSLWQLALQETSNGLHCVREENGARSLKLSLHGRKNSTGDWVTDFSARKEISNSSRNLNVEVQHKIFECSGKTVIHIEGIAKEHHNDHGNTMENILFNLKCGKNAVIINNGRSAFRMNPEKEDGHGILLSSRPLNDNELFEVRLESKISKWGGNSMGVGVTANSISSLTLPLWMMEVKSKTWMMYNQDIYVDGNKKSSNYAKNLGSLQAGDRVGVMRNKNGELHIFINGADQGVAASGIPESVHGVIDIIRDSVSVTIV